MKLSRINLADISIDGSTQQREKIALDIVAEYAEAMRCGAKFPSVTLFFDGAAYWLADGFHRFHACKSAEITDIAAEIHNGTVRDARLFSAGTNCQHGIRLTNADKRKSVMVLLTDKEWSTWTDRNIAKHCHVTQPFVSGIRKDLSGEVKVKPHVITVITPAPEAAPVLEVGIAKTPVLPESEEPEDEDFGDQDLAKEHLRTLEELQKAHSRIEILDKKDLAKEVEAWAAKCEKIEADWSLKFDQLDGRLQLAVTQKNEAAKDATRAQSLLAKVRKELGVEKNAEIIGAIQDLRR